MRSHEKAVYLNSLRIITCCDWLQTFFCSYVNFFSHPFLQNIEQFLFSGWCKLWGKNDLFLPIFHDRFTENKYILSKCWPITFFAASPCICYFMIWLIMFGWGRCICYVKVYDSLNPIGAQYIIIHNHT